VSDEAEFGDAESYRLGLERLRSGMAEEHKGCGALLLW